MRAAITLATAALLGACANAAPAPRPLSPAPPPAILPEASFLVRALARQFAPDRMIATGPAPQQRVALFLPKGPGPHPVVAFIHGGCYKASVAGMEALYPMFRNLANHGVAVWGVGYRRIDEPGGAYPGLYADVGAALDALPTQANALGLRPGGVVVAGHSAGGHLALWAGARTELPSTSPLNTAAPLRPARVVAFAPPTDLSDAAAIDKACGKDAQRRIVGAADAGRPDPLADTSPSALFPTAPITLVAGARDALVPARGVAAYAERAKAKGVAVELTTLPLADHVAPVNPLSRSFPQTREILLRAAGVTPPARTD